MELNLREHQLKVIDSLREGFKAGHRTQVLYAPTGFGKTEIAIYSLKVRARSWRHAGRPLEIQFIGVNPGVLRSDT
jgi:DNA repair protein RadD